MNLPRLLAAAAGLAALALVASPSPAGDRRGASADERRTENLERFDADGDGRLDRGERAARRRARRESRRERREERREARRTRRGR
jgi:hypothetical protein